MITPKKYNRRLMREKSLQILYASEMNQEGVPDLAKDLFSDIGSAADKEFSYRLIDYVIKNRDLLDDKIKEKVTNWEMGRIAIIDRVLLRIGIAELLFFPDIPPKVSINEVIEIAKDYSTSNSGKFINGILDAILTDLKNAGKLNKTGRGLIEESLPKRTSQK